MTLFEVLVADVNAVSVLSDTDPEVDDGGSQQDSDTLHQISHHVDESRLHTGVAVMVTMTVAVVLLVQLTAGKAVTVAV